MISSRSQSTVPVTASPARLRDVPLEGSWVFIQPTPGHTPGSITLLTDVDGRKVAFSGDLMHSPGKVQTLYDLQYYYEEHEGADLSAYSLAELSKHAPDVALPFARARNRQTRSRLCGKR